MKRTLIYLCLLLPSLINSQSTKLANEYFRNGEYEKAKVLYGPLLEKNPNHDYYLNRYIECLLALEEYGESEKLMNSRIRKDPKNYSLFLTYGKILNQQNKSNEATTAFEKAIKFVPEDRNSILRVASAFTTMNKYDLAIKAYEKGMKANKEAGYSYYIADLFRRKGDIENMVHYYIESILENHERADRIKTYLQRFLHVSDFGVLQRQLYQRLQVTPDEILFPDLLAWSFIHQKDYGNALRQVKALDQRLNENGNRVYSLGRVAYNDQDFESAISAFEYIVEEKDFSNSFYVDAKTDLLRSKRKKITVKPDYSEADLLDLEAEYEDFLAEFGRSKETSSIMSELGELQAFYLNDLDKAVAILDELIRIPQVNKYVQANAKLSLGDFYLMKGEIWESTLLYSQVDKAFKEELLGQEARFRNAKLSYFAGDFEWAQSQFDILKASTSKFISNDALDLSIFILDNLGLDTTALPLMYYSQAELEVFQNKFQDAVAKLELLVEEFPEHSLEDDIYYLKANLYKKQRMYEEAIAMYQRIIDDFSEDIRADNALFELASLYENVLGEKEKAKELYEKLFIEFSNSTFAVEARKRYRVLRGDTVQ